VQLLIIIMEISCRGAMRIKKVYLPTLVITGDWSTYYLNFVGN